MSALCSAVNLSEGRDPVLVGELADLCGPHLLDVHRDPSHHRSVLTLAAERVELLGALRRLVHGAVDYLDLAAHRGVHPRFGVVDVVPFAPIGEIDLVETIAARDELAIWAGAVLGVPCFLFGPLPDGGMRTLPEVRRGAFDTMVPDTGPSRPHPSAGAIAVGARPPLVAYNLWLSGASLPEAQKIAGVIRSSAVRALGFELDGGIQVSCNLVQPEVIGPAELYDLVKAVLPASARIVDAELVGLIPERVLARTPMARWDELGLSSQDALEARLADPSLRKRRS